MSNKLVEWGIFAVLIIALIISIKSCNDNVEKRKVAERNSEALVADIVHYETKNGEIVAVAEGLQLEVNDLKKLNEDLYYEIKDLNIKLKDAQSAVKVVTEYVYQNPDTVEIYITETDSTNVAHFSINEEYLQLTADIDLQNEVILPGNFDLVIPNEVSIVESIKRSGWWIFKRKVGVEVHVVNSNPYIIESDIFYVDLRK